MDETSSKWFEMKFLLIYFSFSLIGNLLTLGSEDMEGNQICLAFAIIAAEESTVEWKWFFERCKEHIVGLDGQSIGLISDRGKGLLTAIAQVFQHLSPLFCAKHIQRNIQANQSINDANM
jgi:transposase-like protein